MTHSMRSSVSRWILSILRLTRILRMAWLAGLAGATAIAASGQTNLLQYAPAPPDNPLKGFVNYLNNRTNFPHSLNWGYIALREVMTGPASFDWTVFERDLNRAAAQGNQFIPRFYLDYPGKPCAVPQYLVDDGVAIRRWTNHNTYTAISYTPDYEDVRLRSALTNFIAALGRRYDGDPRLAFIEVGLLGTWGEWHNHPRNEWFASKTVQGEVLDAFATAFQKTKIVVRYPAGPDDYVYSANHERAIGYHDDSFAWATMATGRQPDAWFFMARMARAGALEKWRNQPIGGEVRPEVWDCLFSDKSCAPPGQEFDRCVRAAHASWLAHDGVFRPSLNGSARERAIQAAQALGYEFYVMSAEMRQNPQSQSLHLSLALTNSGVAPFYYDWPVQLGLLSPDERLSRAQATSWRMSRLWPGQTADRWEHRLDIRGLPPGRYRLMMQVANPLPSGRPLRFANRTQDQHLRGWLSLGAAEIGPP